MGMTDAVDPLVAAMAVLATEGFALLGDVEKARGLQTILTIARRMSIEGANAADKEEAIARVLGAWGIAGIKYQAGRSPAQAHAYLQSAMDSRWLDEVRRRKRALGKLKRAHSASLATEPAPYSDEAARRSLPPGETEMDQLYRLLERGVSHLRDEILPKVLEQKRSGHASTRQGFEDRVAIATAQATQYSLARVRVAERYPTATSDEIAAGIETQMATQTKAQDRSMFLIFSHLENAGPEADPLRLAYKAALFIKARRSGRATGEPE